MENATATTSKPRITILMQFEGDRELIFDTYSTLDIQRNNKQLNINTTNTADDLAFNTLYDMILEYLGERKTFDIKLRMGENGAAAFRGMMVNYHLNTEREMLTFGQK